MPFIIKRCRLPLLLLLPLLGLAGCSSLSLQSQGGAGDQAAAVVVPATPEGQLLAALGGATPGAEILLPDEVRAVADETYAAASGRPCRRVQLHYPEGRSAERLACEIDGRWQWVPAVTLNLAD